MTIREFIDKLETFPDSSLQVCTENIDGDWAFLDEFNVEARRESRMLYDPIKKIPVELSKALVIL